MAVRMDVAELTAFLSEVFPQVCDDFIVEHVAEKSVRVRLKVREDHLRPGGTVSGPAMFGLADVAVYLAVLSMVGPKALAVTTNASIDFLRKPGPGVDLIAECRLLKLGRVLAVGECLLYSEGLAEPVARASLTYSLPPKG